MRFRMLVMVGAWLVGWPIWAAGPGVVTVATKDGRHTGTLSVSQVELKTSAGGVTKVPFGQVALLQLGDDMDFVRTRDGKRVKGAVKLDGWVLKEKGGELPLTRGDLRFVVPQTPIGTLQRGQIMHGATASGMTFHVRVPEKYDPKAGGPAIVLFHGSNAFSADYLLGITQRWPKLAADYVLIGIDGEWPTQKDPDGPPAYVYTYVDFVGKSKYKGFPGTDRESPALVAEAVAEIKEQVKLTKIFITGHSQGGFLVYSLLMNYPDLFAGGMPIAAGLIFQCEPSAYEDAEIRAKQRKLPIVILHGERDPLVSVEMGRSAYESFLRGGFPMLRLMTPKQGVHFFISLPFEEGIRWLESMASDDPKALVGFAERAIAGGQYRDATAYLKRAQELDSVGKQTAAIAAARAKVETAAAGPAKAVAAAIAKNEGNGWVASFDEFRRQFEFTDAGAPVMAAYAKLAEAHERPAETLWGEVRKAFNDGDKEGGYRRCEEIVNKYYASSYYRYARQTLAGRKA